jgi:Polyketide cyclase / dehydrase and lipid transport
MHVTSQTTVTAAIETVWDALSNHVGISRWAPGLTVTMDRLGTGDPNGVGAVRRIAAPGPAPDIVEEVVAFEPPHLLGYKALSGTPFSRIRRRGTAHRGRCGHPHQLHRLLHCQLSAGQGSSRGDLSGAASHARARVHKAKLKRGR